MIYNINILFSYDSLYIKRKQMISVYILFILSILLCTSNNESDDQSGSIKSECDIDFFCEKYGKEETSMVILRLKSNSFATEIKDKIKRVTSLFSFMPKELTETKNFLKITIKRDIAKIIKENSSNTVTSEKNQAGENVAVILEERMSRYKRFLENKFPSLDDNDKITDALNQFLQKTSLEKTSRGLERHENHNLCISTEYAENSHKNIEENEIEADFGHEINSQGENSPLIKTNTASKHELDGKYIGSSEEFEFLDLENINSSISINDKMKRWSGVYDLRNINESEIDIFEDNDMDELKYNEKSNPKKSDKCPKIKHDKEFEYIYQKLCLNSKIFETAKEALRDNEQKSATYNEYNIDVKFLIQIDNLGPSLFADTDENIVLTENKNLVVILNQSDDFKYLDTVIGTAIEFSCLDSSCDDNFNIMCFDRIHNKNVSSLPKFVSEKIYEKICIQFIERGSDNVYRIRKFKEIKPRS